CRHTPARRRCEGRRASVQDSSHGVAGQRPRSKGPLMTLTSDDLRFLAGHIKDAATFDMGGLPDKSLKRLAKHLKQVAADLGTETPEVTEERAGFEARAWAEQYTPGMSQKEAAAFKRGHAAGWRDASTPAPQNNTDRFGEFLRAEMVCATQGIAM